MLAAAELQRVFVGLLGDAHALQLLHGAGLSFFFWQFAHPHRRQGQVFQHREVGKQVELLEDHAHFFAYIVDDFDVVANLHAVDPQHTLLVFFQAVDAADQRGLAGAGRAADHDALARLDVQVNIPQHMEAIAVPLVDFLERDDGR